jgi:hypothetical protein
MTPFKIIFPMELTPYKYYDNDYELDFDSSLINAQWDFSERFRDSPWSILLGGTEYFFEVGDFSYIWGELPNFLHQCVNDQLPYAYLHFADQGTDTILLVEPASENRLLISIVRNYFDHIRADTTLDLDSLGVQRIAVSKHEFLAEWLIVVNTMNRLLVEHNLIARDDPSIPEYLALLPTQ